MVPEADLIFGPYNYIIDPVIRGDMDIKLSGAVLVFDEGHNVLDAAMDALSITVSLKQLQDIKKEVCFWQDAFVFVLLTNWTA